MEHQALTDDGVPEADALVAAEAEEFVVMVVVRLDDGIVHTGEDVGQVVGLEGLLERKDELDDGAHLLAAVELLLGEEAVVAHTAVVLQAPSAAALKAHN